MNRVELEGVLAHELSHIKNYDILVSTLAVTLVGFIALMSDIGIRTLWWGGGRNRNNNDNGSGLGGDPRHLRLRAAAPRPAHRAAHAVRREPPASRWPTCPGVELTRYPPGLISALEKLRDDQTVVHAHSRATAHLWIEQPMPTAGGEGKRSPGQPHVRHPPAARGAHRRTPGALT